MVRNFLQSACRRLNAQTKRIDKAEHGIEAVYLSALALDFHGIHIVAAALLAVLIVIAGLIHAFGGE